MPIAVFILTAFLLLGSLVPATFAADAPPADARATTDALLHHVMTVLRDPKLSKLEKQDKVRQIAYDAIDFTVLGKLSLGRPWKDLTDAQRKDFVEELKKHLTNTYIHAVDAYTDQDITITGDQKDDADGDWTVKTHIVAEKEGTRKEVATVDYRLRKEGQEWKIIDVTIDNVSLAINSRAEFQDIINNGGFDRLMKLLREKNAQGK